MHTRHTIYPYRYIKDVIDCLLFRYSHTLGTLWPICIRFTLLLLYGTYGTIRDIWGGVFIFCNSLTHISQFLHIFIFVPPKGDHDETSTKTKG